MFIVTSYHPGSSVTILKRASFLVRSSVSRGNQRSKGLYQSGPSVSRGTGFHLILSQSVEIFSVSRGASVDRCFKITFALIHVISWYTNVRHKHDKIKRKYNYFMIHSAHAPQTQNTAIQASRIGSSKNLVMQNQRRVKNGRM